jgi:uncharacterized coiled-coil protein SlyX
MPTPESRISFVLQELVRRSEEESRRLRDVEQRLEAIETRLSTLENIELERTQKNEQRFAESAKSFNNINDDITKLKLNLEKLVKQMDRLARKSELKEIETMLGFMPKQDVKEAPLEA